MISFKSFLIEGLTEDQKVNIVKHGLLSFGQGNAKVPFANISLPAGYACPFAGHCRTKAVENPETGKWTLEDVVDMQYRCYAARDEAMYPATRKSRHRNYALLHRLKTREELAYLIYKSFITKGLDKTSKYFRLHIAGDFFSQAYFDAWIAVANKIPDTIFYGYTKSLPFWVKRINNIPPNLRLVASYGGKEDHLIKEHNLKYALVIDTPQQAEDLGLEIDVDDSHAFSRSPKSFCILLHGGQQAGAKSKAAKENAKIIDDLKDKIKPPEDHDFEFPEED